MEPSLHMLEYDAILQKLADFTHTRAARERALGLHPLQDLMQIRLRADQIDQACRMLDAATPPLSSLEGAEAALPLLALRDPASKVVEAILAELGEPLAQTSANLHGCPAATCAAELAPQILAEADLVLDAGAAPLAVPSTIVDCTGASPRVLREGAIPAADVL